MKTAKYKLKIIRRGFSTLPTVLILGGLMIEVAVAMTFLIDILGSTSFSARQSAEAFTATQAAIEDTLLKVVRDKNCPSVTCVSPFDLTVSGRTVSVTICKDSCAGPGMTQIDAIGSAGLQQRHLRAIVSVNPTTGKVTLESLNDTVL